MPIEILMPALSPTMEHGNIAKWHKKEGDKIKPGDILLEIETDKATMEVEAVDRGFLAKIFVNNGSEAVPVNMLIALILEDGEHQSLADNYQPQQLTLPTDIKIEIIAEEPKQLISLNKEERIFASPLAKKIAEIEQIDLRQITGTGPHGRIIKMDLQSTPKPAQSISSRNPTEYTSIPNNNIRKVIAKRLCESTQTIPHFYLSLDCEIDKLLSIRVEMNADAIDYKLSVNDFIIKAVAMALQHVPAANASWSTEAILQYNNIDIAVAVATPTGLITPIIKNANQKSLSTISNQIKELATRAKENKLSPEEYQGGGFSISNLGMFGIKQFNAIINPPQAAILAIGSGEERAVVKGGQIQIANIMSVTLSCDHRVIDGAVGAEFLKYFKKFIENPVTMLV